MEDSSKGESFPISIGLVNRSFPVGSVLEVLTRGIDLLLVVHGGGEEGVLVVVVGWEEGKEGGDLKVEVARRSVRGGPLSIYVAYAKVSR